MPWRLISTSAAIRPFSIWRVRIDSAWQTFSSLVKDLTSGGSAPKSDLDQARERIAGADFTIAQIEQALKEAGARYRQVIGSEPTGLTPVGFPSGVPQYPGSGGCRGNRE